jgi:hypothetical protein
MDLKLEVVVLPAADVARPNPGSYASFASFGDRDGNGWVLQEVTQRFPRR